MKVDDEVRIKVLSALLEPKVVSPNFEQLKRKTGLHKATIKSSIEFLQKEGVIEGFGPKVNFRKFGYNLEVLVFLQVDMSEHTLFEEFLAEIKQDPHAYMVAQIVGGGTWNLMVRHLYPDVESYHHGTQARYYEKIPHIYKLIRDRLIFYVTEPFYKRNSRMNSVIQMLREEKLSPERKKR